MQKQENHTNNDVVSKFAKLQVFEKESVAKSMIDSKMEKVFSIECVKEYLANDPISTAFLSQTFGKN